MTSYGPGPLGWCPAYSAPSVSSAMAASSTPQTGLPARPQECRSLCHCKYLLSCFLILKFQMMLFRYCANADMYVMMLLGPMV